MFIYNLSTLKTRKHVLKISVFNKIDVQNTNEFTINLFLRHNYYCLFSDHPATGRHGDDNDD